MFFKDLFEHMRWADSEVWRTVFSMPEIESDARISDLLYHIHLTQHAFLSIWHKEKPEFPKPTDFENLVAISKWGHEYHQNVAGYLKKVKETGLEETIDIPWAKRFIEEKFGKKPQATILAETMLQVSLHSVHHRAQIQMRLRELGGEPPLIDFIAWLWLGKPEADWPPL